MSVNLNDTTATAIIRRVSKNSNTWFAVMIVNYACFQCLETYEGEEGLKYWEQRLSAAGIEYTIERD